MNSQDLDTLIDTVAREMISDDPPLSLTHRVMSRVRERIEPAPRGSVWAFRTAGAVMLCAVVATFVVSRHREPAPPRLLPSSEAPQARAVEHPFAPVTQPVTRPPGEPSFPRADAGRASPRGASAPAPVDEEPVTSSLALLVIEPILLPALEMPPLDTQASSFEAIEIDDITIEPLAASND